jgi:putative spermidine/putrescine transport system permease protein
MAWEIAEPPRGAPAAGAADGDIRPGRVSAACILPALLLLAVLAAGLGALLRYSVLTFIPGSLQSGGLTLRNFQSIVAPQYLRAIGDTVVLSLETTALTLAASYPVAYALARGRSARLRAVLLILTLAPFFTGAVVRAYAWIVVLGNQGFLNSLLLGLHLRSTPYPMLFTLRSVLVGLVHFSMPVMILVLAAGISHIDPVYERAALSLGAGPVRTFLRITLPLSLPGVISGTVVVFAWTFSAFPTPALLGGGRVRMIANVVKDLAMDSFNWPGGAAFAVVALGVSFAVVAAVGRSVERLQAGRGSR